VVYPAAGFHASYFSAGLWLGLSASEGFGCDDSRGPSRTVAPGGRNPINTGWQAIFEAAVRIALPIVVLNVTVIGIPVAAWRLVRATFVPMAITIDSRKAVDALRRSRSLVAGRRRRVAATMAVLCGMASVASVVGGLTVLLFAASAPVVVRQHRRVPTVAKVKPSNQAEEATFSG
jgi:hypothetical protein